MHTSSLASSCLPLQTTRIQLTSRYLRYVAMSMGHWQLARSGVRVCSLNAVSTACLVSPTDRHVGCQEQMHAAFWRWLVCDVCRLVGGPCISWCTMDLSVYHTPRRQMGTPHRGRHQEKVSRVLQQAHPRHLLDSCQRADCAAAPDPIQHQLPVQRGTTTGGVCQGKVAKGWVQRLWCNRPCHHHATILG